MFEGTLPGWWITSIICRTSRKFHPTFFEGRVVAFGILVTQENREKMVTVIVVSHDA